MVVQYAHIRADAHVANPHQAVKILEKKWTRNWKR